MSWTSTHPMTFIQWQNIFLPACDEIFSQIMAISTEADVVLTCNRVHVNISPRVSPLLLILSYKIATFLIRHVSYRHGLHCSSSLTSFHFILSAQCHFSQRNATFCHFSVCCFGQVSLTIACAEKDVRNR